MANKDLMAPSIQEKWDISWGGKTRRGAKDDNPLNATIGQDLSLDCSAGCTVNVPNPGFALILVNKVLPQGTPSGGGNCDTGNDVAGSSGAGRGVENSVSISIIVVFVLLFQVFYAFLQTIRSLSPPELFVTYP